MSTLEKLASKLAERKTEAKTWRDAADWATSEGCFREARLAEGRARFAEVIAEVLQTSITKLVRRGNIPGCPMSEVA